MTNKSWFNATWAVLHASAAVLAGMAVMAHIGSTIYHIRRV